MTVAFSVIKSAGGNVKGAEGNATQEAKIPIQSKSGTIQGAQTVPGSYLTLRPLGARGTAWAADGRSRRPRSAPKVRKIPGAVRCGKGVIH